jgi:hypothetical protein
MKKLFALLAVVLIATGCGRIENSWSKFKSATGTMTRTVVLYNVSGTPIKSWVTDNEITYEGPVAGFIDKNGVTVRISGTFTIEGK